eukprot:TRINITY_DN3768_c1_g1_i1.p1 TRINITY_DN3768_c1_g1~~TRINITY_DN3768_c1_g1_i1.p1  ORF type:complete len:296 (+),score=41.81 TRINITY_DN3768_c1_g1_i1:165-1052(+)
MPSGGVKHPPKERSVCGPSFYSVLSKVKKARASKGPTMQVFVSFPDAGFPDVVFEAASKSLVADAARAAANEWGVDAEFLELSFSESVLPQNSQLVSHLIDGDSQLTASLIQVFGFNWFTDDDKRKKLMQHLSKMGEKFLSLDTPTFTTDGCFRFDLAWIPDIEISFINPLPSITSVELAKPDFWNNRGSLVTNVGLTGLSNITSIGDDFMTLCSSITTLDFSCLTNLTKIGNFFLAACSSLTSLDLTSFCNVIIVGEYFLARCPSLRMVKGTKPGSEVRKAIEISDGLDVDFTV